jgi:hypothetical protein
MSRIFFIQSVSGLLSEEVDVVIVCLGKDVAAGSCLFGKLFSSLKVKFVCTHVLSEVLLVQIHWSVEVDELG